MGGLEISAAVWFYGSGIRFPKIRRYVRG